MIRLGVCIGPERAEQATRIGFDYIEMNLSTTAALSEEDYTKALDTVLSSPIRAEAFNTMIPAEYPLTGPDVNLDAVQKYLDKAIPRAASFGAKVIVFGSGGARRVPERWNADVAWAQLIAFLRMCLPILNTYGVTLAIEPLRREETNIIHTVREGAALAAAASYPFEGENRFASNKPRDENVNRVIGVLGDTYHMVSVGEPYSAFVEAAKYLMHVHTAEAVTRVYPSPNDGTDYNGLFAALKIAGYNGRVSIEGMTDDFDADAPKALAVLKEARDNTYK